MHGLCAFWARERSWVHSEVSHHCRYLSVMVHCTGEEKAYQGTRIGALLFVCCQLGDSTLVESVGSVEAHVGFDVEREVP
jgi:hypothetical protein